MNSALQPGSIPKPQTALFPPVFAQESPRFSTFVFNRFRILPSSVSCKSFACHSYENCRVCTNNSHSGTRPSRQEPGEVGTTSETELAAVPQVVVCFVQPVFARRVEDVEVHGIFERPGFVGHHRRDAQHLAGAHHDFLAVDREFQRALQDVRHLFVVVVMQRHVRTLLHQHARQHDFAADHHLAVNERIQFLALHVFPGDVFRLGWVARFMSPYNFAALSCRYKRASSMAFSSVKAPSATSSASAAAAAVRAERTASQNVSSAPTASLNGNASEANIIFSGYSEIHCLRMFFNSDG